jgi:hypothetical protein
MRGKKALGVRLRVAAPKIKMDTRLRGYDGTHVSLSLSFLPHSSAVLRVLRAFVVNLVALAYFFFHSGS